MIKILWYHVITFLLLYHKVHFWREPCLFSNAAKFNSFYFFWKKHTCVMVVLMLFIHDDIIQYPSVFLGCWFFSCLGEYNSSEQPNSYSYSIIWKQGRSRDRPLGMTAWRNWMSRVTALLWKRVTYFTMPPKKTIFIFRTVKKTSSHNIMLHLRVGWYEFIKKYAPSLISVFFHFCLHRMSWYQALIE